MNNMYTKRCGAVKWVKNIALFSYELDFSIIAYETFVLETNAI